MESKTFYTAVNTDDLEKTVAFYTEMLGFKVKHNIDIPTGKIAVLENEAGARLDITETPGEKGFRALRTNTDDIDAAVKEFRSKGYEVTGPMEISTGRAILVKDPNGVLINITQHIKNKG